MMMILLVVSRGGAQLDPEAAPCVAIAAVDIEVGRLASLPQLVELHEKIIELRVEHHCSLLSILYCTTYV